MCNCAARMWVLVPSTIAAATGAGKRAGGEQARWTQQEEGIEG